MPTIIAGMLPTECPTMLEIQKLPDGGYLVGDAYRMDGSYRSIRFGSSSIDEALKYLKAKFEPKVSK